ncbi:MAG: hypothetical protein ACI9JN_000820 [Bacteroidia bacterium]|jgi:hypothetical protein
MKIRHIILLLLVSLSGCKKEQLDDCFSSTGDDISIARPLKSFDCITIGDKFKLILSQDTTQPERIILTGGENILEGVSAEVDNGLLTIENCNKCNFVRSYNRMITLEVFVHNLTELSLFGATNITNSDTLHLKDLYIYHSALEDLELTVDVTNEIYVESINSGGTVLHGNTKILKGSIEEITNLDARDLLAEEALVDIHTPLDCYINATKLIYVGIYNKGNMYYVKEPSGLKELYEQKGTGQLLKLP